MRSDRYNRYRRGGSSRQQFANDVSVGVGQSMIAPLKAEREALVVDAQEVQHRGVQVVNGRWLVDHVVRKVVCFSSAHAWPDAASGHPDRKAARVMVAAVVGGARFALAIDRSAEFASPDDKRLFQQAALRKSLTSAAVG